MFFNYVWWSETTLQLPLALFLIRMKRKQRQPSTRSTRSRRRRRSVRCPPSCLQSKWRPQPPVLSSLYLLPNPRHQYLAWVALAPVGHRSCCCRRGWAVKLNCYGDASREYSVPTRSVCICFCPNGDFCHSGQSIKPHIYLMSAPNWLLNCRIMLVSMVTRRWEVLILLSWRQGYTVCDLTCAPITAMHFVFSKAETVDLFSLERCVV